METTASKLTVKLCQQSAHCLEIASLETAAHSFLETAAHSLETAAHSLETDASNQQVQAAETADRDWVCVALMSPSVGSCDDVRYAHPHTCLRNHTQHTSAYVSIRQEISCVAGVLGGRSRGLFRILEETVTHRLPLFGTRCRCFCDGRNRVMNLLDDTSLKFKAPKRPDSVPSQFCFSCPSTSMLSPSGERARARERSPRESLRQRERPQAEREKEKHANTHCDSESALKEVGDIY